MHFVTYAHDGEQRIGLHDAGLNEVVDPTDAVPNCTSMLVLVRGGSDCLAAVHQAFDRCRRIAFADIELDAPIPRPDRNVFCVGKNHRAHATEFSSSGFDASNGDGSAVPDIPVVFTKIASSVIGPGKPIPAWMDLENSVDYEGELAIMVGRGGRGIKKRDAMDHVFGYTIINDATARNLQQCHKQWFLGKSLDDFCPMGAAIVTEDEIADIDQLEKRTYVNGEVRQRTKISDLIFGIPELIESILPGITLAPGDIIATGTPAGVGIEFNPPKFLRVGDKVTIEIDALGELQNPVE